MLLTGFERARPLVTRFTPKGTRKDVLDLRFSILSYERGIIFSYCASYQEGAGSFIGKSAWVRGGCRPPIFSSE